MNLWLIIRINIRIIFCVYAYNKLSMCWLQKNLTWPKCKAQLNKKYLCNPLFADWWANLAYHRFTSGEPCQKSTRIKICKKISIQPDLNLWWTRLTDRFRPILTVVIRVFTKSDYGEGKIQVMAKGILTPINFYAHFIFIILSFNYFIFLQI